MTTSLCYPDTTNWSCEYTDEQIAGLDPVMKARSEALAWSALFSLTAGRIAICPEIVRPCSLGCARQTWYAAPVVGGEFAGAAPGGFFTPFVGIGGAWFNSCGCARPNSCSCTTIQEVILPGVIGDIEGVYLDGVCLDPSSYRVDNNNRLVRTDGLGWPGCQDMNLAWDAEGAFTIRYWNGVAPNDMISYAAGILAVEFYKACSGNKTCRLPRGTTNVVRQGVSYEIQNNMFVDGSTSIPEVDTVVRLYNPHAMKTPSRVLSPDVPRGRTQTWSRA